MRTAPLLLAAALSSCASVPAAPATETETTPAPARTSTASPAEASVPPAASGEAPCTPEPEPGRAGSRIREGTAVLNATPFDLGVTVPGPGETKAPMPRVSFEAARAPDGATTGDFAVWLDGETWHVRANGQAVKPDTLLQARVSLVTDVYAEGDARGLTFHSQALVSPGRCWNDLPRADPSAVFAGFDWQSPKGSGGIRFRAHGACFRLTLRVAGKEELPRVWIGSGRTKIAAGKLQDTIEICRSLGERS